MGERMNDVQRMLVEETIQEADPCPDDIDDCVQLVMSKKILSLKKVRTYFVELRQVCEQALDARAARPPSPPTSTIAPPSSADPVPGPPLHGDGALLAAAQGSRDAEKVRVHLAISDDFKFANAKFTNAPLSYVRERTVKDLELQGRDGIIQIRWNDPNLPHDADHIARTTVFILVGEEEASRVEMNVDILFGKHCREERDAQLQAACASMDIRSAAPTLEVQPDDSCAGSVAEAASLPAQAVASLPPQPSYALLFWGADPGRQAADFVSQYEAAGQPGALRRGAQVPA